MIATLIPIEIILPPPLTPRSVGTHVSSIIRCIGIERGLLMGDLADELAMSDIRVITDPVARLRISIGLAWEEWFIPNILAREGVVDHPGEYKVDDVYMSPDGESLSVIIMRSGKAVTDLMVHEVKATYKSTNTVGAMEREVLWLMQIKAYCKALMTRFARIYVLFLCGDYTYPITPQLKCWQLEFTQEEIDDNWTLLNDYKLERLRKEATA